MTLDEIKKELDEDWTLRNCAEPVYVRRIRALLALLDECKPFIRVYTQTASRRHGKTTAQKLYDKIDSREPLEKDDAKS